MSKASAIAIQPSPTGVVERSARPLASGFFPAAITTFAADEALDLGAFRAHVEHLIDAGVDGIVAAGTTGEAHALSFDERRAVFEAAVAQAAGRVRIVGGVGATTTREAVRLAGLAADCGCDAALALTPWFEKPAAEALASYYDELAGRARLPLLLYHNPSRTGVDWSPEAIGAIAQKLRGAVIGIKDSTNDAARAAALRICCPEDFLIFSGGPHLWDAFQAAGADGQIDGPCNALAAESVRAFRGDAAARILVAAAQDCFARTQNFIGLLKAVMRALGLPAGQPRRPFHEVRQDELGGLQRVLQKGGRLAAAGNSGSNACSFSIAHADAVHVAAEGLESSCLEAEPIAAQPVSLYRAEPGLDQYSHHPCIAHFGGRFFAAWSNGKANEDSPGQLVRFATSEDGTAWTAPQEVMPRPDGAMRWTAGGLWPREDGLWLLATRYTRARYVDGECAPGICWENLATEGYRFDGVAWQPQGMVLNDFYANEAPRSLPDGRWMMTGVNGRHDAIAAISETADGTRWRAISLSKRTESSKLTEPSWYALDDGTLRVFLRDDGGSRRLFLSESADGGARFSPPRPTDFPDAQAKFFALRLPGGPAALVCNPSSSGQGRKLLALALSCDGRAFERAVKLRHDPAMTARSPGMHKAAGFQYPNACIANGALWVIYSVNKEDVEALRVPV